MAPPHAPVKRLSANLPADTRPLNAPSDGQQVVGAQGTATSSSHESGRSIDGWLARRGIAEVAQNRRPQARGAAPQSVWRSPALVYRNRAASDPVGERLALNPTTPRGGRSTLSRLLITDCFAEYMRVASPPPFEPARANIRPVWHH